MLDKQAPGGPRTYRIPLSADYSQTCIFTLALPLVVVSLCAQILQELFLVIHFFLYCYTSQTFEEVAKYWYGIPHPNSYSDFI